jgi:hypothetical protein
VTLAARLKPCPSTKTLELPDAQSNSEA